MTVEDYIHSVKDKPFEWGSHDCYHFASKVIELQTGKGLPLTYSYSDAKGGLRQLRRTLVEARIASPEALADHLYMRVAKGVLPPSGSLCMRLYDETAFGLIFGISLNHQVVFPGNNGLEFTDIDFNIDKFWVV